VAASLPPGEHEAFSQLLGKKNGRSLTRKILDGLAMRVKMLLGWGAANVPSEELTT
jgi:hypothetical protein